jgi:RTX calcium-binding nonapeptide repeat (4 copies)
VRGRTLFLALVAALSVLSATAVAGGHRVVKGSKGADELTLGAGGNRVFARAGNDTVDGGGGNDRLRGGRGDDALRGGRGADRLLGGQDNDFLDGGKGNDVLNGSGDGRDKDRIVCGGGYDVVVLGRGDVILAEGGASEYADEDEDAPADEESDDPVLEESEPDDDGGCEKLKLPGGAPRPCASHHPGCDEAEQPCAATNREGCGDEEADEPCVATYSDCDDPVEDESAPDPADEALDPEEP